MYGEFSRYRHADLLRGKTGHLYLDLRATCDYFSGEETLYPIIVGDTLQSVAARAFAGFPEPAMLWWILADFQPEPIIDPTVDLVEGDWLIIPSRADVQSWLMSHSYGEGGGDL